MRSKTQVESIAKISLTISWPNRRKKQTVGRTSVTQYETNSPKKVGLTNPKWNMMKQTCRVRKKKKKKKKTPQSAALRSMVFF